jgi:hypothetical protein
MKRIPMAALAFMLFSCVRTEDAPVFTDVSGLWRMRETHENFEGTLRWTWLEIRQDGDRLDIRAWEDGAAWTAVGKGRVEKNKALFQWWGRDKRWRGTAALEWRAAELKGVFQRLDVDGIGPQYCRGSRASSQAGRPFDFSAPRP